MQNTRDSQPVLRRKLAAFTLLESLLTLFVTSFLAVALSGSVQTVFHQVEEQLFFLEFEQVYKNSQRLAVTSQQAVQLTVDQDVVKNGFQQVKLPRTVQLVRGAVIDFDKKGGNSSLAKLEFQIGEKRVYYQLYMGSGRYKKSEK